MRLVIKRIVVWSLFAGYFLWGVSADAQVTFPEKPDDAHFFVDNAKIIGESEQGPIDQIAGALLKEERIPLLVVTIPTLLDYKAAEYSIEEYAKALFDHWGVGFKDRNYGILLLISRGDRKARIELGAGWGIKHDAQSSEIMEKLIIPEFRRENYSLGILAGVEGLDAMARGLALPKVRIPWYVYAIQIGGILLIVGTIYSLFKSGRTGWGWALIAFLGVMIFFALRSAASGGSGGSFGGGFSGGGGASGSW